jgi:hypothetical protein
MKKKSDVRRHVAGMVKMKNAYKMLVGKPGWERSLEKQRLCL